MSSIKPGLYLEVKKGTIGEARTAQDVEYRNFWMTLSQEGGLVELLLLDNDFKPTGLKESRPVADFESGALTYIPQGEKRYQLLLKKLTAKRPAPSPSKAPAPAPAKDAPQKPAGWWEAKERQLTEEDLFRRPEKPAGSKAGKKKGEVTTKKSWWDK